MTFAVRPALRYFAEVVLLAAVYAAAAWVGLRYVTIGHSVSLVWPPAGIAFAALVLLGPRVWPGVTIGAFLANAATPIPLLAAAVMALGNTAEALVAALLLRRVAGSRPQLEDPASDPHPDPGRRPARRTGRGAHRDHRAWPRPARWPARRRRPALLVWWAGDVLGMLVVAPVLFSWISRPRVRETRGILEVVALVVGTAAAADLGLLQGLRPPIIGEVEYTYLLFPFVVWAAVRFGPRGASLVTLAVAVVAVWHTARGGGPFLSASVGGTLFAGACYLLVLAVTGIVVASAVWSERNRATGALQRSEERLRLALDSARMGIWYWSMDGNALVWDDNLRALYGLAPDEAVTGYEDFMARVHPDDREFVARSVERALKEGDDLDYEFRILHVRRTGEVDRRPGPCGPRARRAVRATSPASAWM